MRQFLDQSILNPDYDVNTKQLISDLSALKKDFSLPLREQAALISQFSLGVMGMALFTMGNAMPPEFLTDLARVSLNEETRKQQQQQIDKKINEYARAKAPYDNEVRINLATAVKKLYKSDLVTESNLERLSSDFKNASLIADSIIALNKIGAENIPNNASNFFIQNKGKEVSINAAAFFAAEKICTSGANNQEANAIASIIMANLI